MATRKTGSNTWAGVKQLAADAGARYPELVAAQWALESGWGKHTSGRHNYFGLKGSGSECKTREVIDGNEVFVTDGFLDFASLRECVQYLVDRWYKDYKGWKGVNNAKSREAAAQQLQSEGYATDPWYAKLLIECMNKKDGSSKATDSDTSYFRVVAMQNTWLKKEPKQSSELGEELRVSVPAGKSYSVLKWEEVPAEAHARAELGYGAGTWYLYEPHWEVQGATSVKTEIDWGDFSCLVTPNLTVGEVLQWDRRRAPQGSMRGRVLRTCQEFQKVREAWGRPLGVTSFYRPEPINQQVGGVPGSRHTTGEAFDVYPSDRSVDSFYQWVRVRWTGGLGDGRARGFVHLDTRSGGGFVPGAGVRPYTEWTY